MAGVEDMIRALGIEIVWVLQQNSVFQPGTAAQCRTFMNTRGSNTGLCVGDRETMPTAGAFDNSPIAMGRGYDILVRRSDMQIIYATTHGTPNGNDNLTGAELVAELRRVTGQ